MRTGTEKIGAGIDSERLQRDADEQENERQRGEQNGERDFVRRFLTLRAFDQRDHAVEKAVALVHRHANDDAIAQHARAAGHGAAIAAALANHRGGFAGDRGFIHARDSFNDIAVRGNDVTGFANDECRLSANRRRELSPRVPLRKRRAIVVVARLAATLRPALCRGLPPSLPRNWRRAR